MGARTSLSLSVSLFHSHTHNYSTLSVSMYVFECAYVCMQGKWRGVTRTSLSLSLSLFHSYTQSCSALSIYLFMCVWEKVRVCVHACVIYVGVHSTTCKEEPDGDDNQED